MDLSATQAAPPLELEITPPSPPNESPRPPELSDALYCAEVICSKDYATEAAVDQALAAKATALGIPLSRRPNPAHIKYTSSAGSAFTVATSHVRTGSTGSASSASTALTSQPSTREAAVPGSAGTGKTLRRSRSLSFSLYDKYLAQIEPNLNQPRFVKKPAPAPESAPSLFSVSTRKSIMGIKHSLQNRLKLRRKSPGFGLPVSCICCREDFKPNPNRSLPTLPCGHTYCSNCLRILINQSSTDESKMPPRCCTQPIPGPIIRAVLTPRDQHVFLKAVQQFSTPWEARLFCPNPDCGEFIPPRKVDPRHPFNAGCHKCLKRVCVMCKRDAHPIGKDCPEDWELDAVLKMGEKSGWRRCYKCRNLVELAQGCTHMTCRCRAQFCYICGGVWDRAVGCPNFCNGEEELERRRAEEQARVAELEAEKLAREAIAAEEEQRRLEAEARSRDTDEFQALMRQQHDEMTRFLKFQEKTGQAMKARHEQQRVAQMERFSEQVTRMKERHAKTTQHLEDRQLAAEMELRVQLDHTERSVRIRLRHMEAYCEALGRSPDGILPPRQITERDLRELGQQYNLRDDMERLHRAKINVMRDRQAKGMEELLERQGAEMERLMNRRDEEVEDLHAGFAVEQDSLSRVLSLRRDRLQKRWALAVEILRHEKEQETRLKYGAVPLPEWLTVETEAAAATIKTTLNHP